MRKHVQALIGLGMAALILAGATSARADVFGDWPENASPKAIGKRVAENFLPRPFRAQTSGKGSIIYPEVCAWYGALTFAQLTGDKDLQDKLVKKFDPLLAAPGTRWQPLLADSVDFSMFGSLPLELYIQTKDKKYLELGQKYADRQWDDPHTAVLSKNPDRQPFVKDGLTAETRPWIDDMYMITIVQVQAFRATHDAKYLDRAALEMAFYLDKLQQPNGLFYHSPDAPFFWGRGNGWVAAGMAELLSSLPQDHPKRARIMEGYKKMMASLLKFQGADGTWRQLIDHPESYDETSSTGMFTFAMITGVKKGWLGDEYKEAARKGWLGLVKFIDKDANISNVCIGTNRLNDLQYYLNRPRNTGDLHGQAPILWCAAALLR